MKMKQLQKRRKRRRKSPKRRNIFPEKRDAADGAAAGAPGGRKPPPVRPVHHRKDAGGAVGHHGGPCGSGGVPCQRRFQLCQRPCAVCGRRHLSLYWQAALIRWLLPLMYTPSNTEKGVPRSCSRGTPSRFRGKEHVFLPMESQRSSGYAPLTGAGSGRR